MPANPRVIEQVFTIPVVVLEDNLDRLFIPLPKVSGFPYLPKKDLLLQASPSVSHFKDSSWT
jgi:hypothetical protein